MKEYQTGTAFPGIIGRTPDVSTPAWPAPNRATEGAPNVLFIVLDDTGFAHLGCYGSPIRTPNIDALAARGLLYNNMHTTALCSPSRACILTGRNHHSNHLACLTNGSTGFPGSDGYMPFENAMISEILKENGYSTYCVGKWHLSPEETNTSAGPYDRWPLGRGFERYYGFLGGDTNQWYPELVYDNHQVEQEASPEEGYHLTPDLTQKAKSFVADAKQIAPNKPFFLYFAVGATHSPHHVPEEWADKYKGRFDAGWDAYRQETFARQKELGILAPDAVLSRHDPDVQDWSKLSADERRLYSRMMEVFAGFLEHTDHHIGELIQFLKEIGEYENTLIMLISDNGSSAEGGPTGSVNECRFFNNVPDTVEDGLKHIDEIGGPTTFNHFPWGWTHAGNTPFRRWKRETYQGGSTDPFVVCWEKGIKSRGEIRRQYGHIIDMVPTVLDALGIEAPRSIRGVPQHPMEGVSLLSTFDDAKAPETHTTQYFEMMGHRSIYHNGWRAVCPWPGTSFVESGRKFGDEISYDELIELDATGWELYRVSKDPGETENLAATERNRLIAMIGMWYVEAGKYNVLPIDSRGTARLLIERPRIAVSLNRYTLYPNTQAIVAAAAPKTLNRPHSFTAEVNIPEGGANGVLLSMGGNDGGFSFYVQDGKLCYLHNYLALDYFYVKATDPLPSGRHFLSMQSVPAGKPHIAQGKGAPVTITLLVDGKAIAEKQLPHTIPLRAGQGGSMIVGVDAGSPVSPEYKPPFKFTGELKRVIVDVSGESVSDHEAEMKAWLRKQ